MEAGRGAVVSMKYELKDDDGELLDSSAAPFEYLHGYGNIIPGLEKALEGSEPGQQKSVVVEPADGYGEPDPAGVFALPKDSFPEGMELEPGMNLVGETPQGPVALRVDQVNDDDVVVDANHPLAGKRLHFEVEVMDVREASEEEIAQGCV